jgi:hypothetical protein
MEDVTVSLAPVPSEAFEDHRGQWVAVREGVLVAAASDCEGLLSDPRVAGDDTLFHVPEGPQFLAQLPAAAFEALAA